MAGPRFQDLPATASAMVTLLQLAERALRTFRANINETDNRLRALTHPQK